MRNTARRLRGVRNCAISALASASLLASTSAQAQSFGFATYNALLLGNGTLVRSNGVSAAARVSAGRYEITFSRPVVNCIAIASVVSAQPAYATSIVKGGTNNTIIVRTFNPTGVLTDFNAGLIVSCGP